MEPLQSKSSRRTERAKLRHQINEAFPPCEPPEPREFYYSDEIEDCMAFFRGDWRALPEKDVERDFTCITWFKEEEFAYYLPAYLRASVRYPHGGAATWMAYDLARRGQIIPALFTDAQLSVVRRVLEYTTQGLDPDDVDETVHDALWWADPAH